MIVSASYRTDIPAFYGRWFLRRLDAGFCRTSNPYNRRVSTVSLRPEDVDGFVFWTKNLGPFLDPLSTIRSRGYPFVVQYTITGYPRELEQAVIPWERSCDQAAETAAKFGGRVVVWRYDPILVTSLTPESFHVDRFAAIAERLAGVVDEVVVSWTQMYKKTTANLNKTRLYWSDPPDSGKCDLVTRLAAVAAGHRIALTVCSQSAYASASGARPAKCIDAARLGDVRVDRWRRRRSAIAPTASATNRATSANTTRVRTAASTATPSATRVPRGSGIGSTIRTASS